MSGLIEYYARRRRAQADKRPGQVPYPSWDPSTSGEDPSSAPPDAGAPVTVPTNGHVRNVRPIVRSRQKPSRERSDPPGDGVDTQTNGHDPLHDGADLNGATPAEPPTSVYDGSVTDGHPALEAEPVPAEAERVNGGPPAAEASFEEPELAAEAAEPEAEVAEGTAFDEPPTVELRVVSLQDGVDVLATPELAEAAADVLATPEATEAAVDVVATPEATEAAVDAPAAPEAAEAAVDAPAAPEAPEAAVAPAPQAPEPVEARVPEDGETVEFALPDAVADIDSTGTEASEAEAIEPAEVTAPEASEAAAPEAAAPEAAAPEAAAPEAAAPEATEAPAPDLAEAKTSDTGEIDALEPAEEPLNESAIQWPPRSETAEVEAIEPAEVTAPEAAVPDAAAPEAAAPEATEAATPDLAQAKTSETGEIDALEPAEEPVNESAIQWPPRAGARLEPSPEQRAVPTVRPASRGATRSRSGLIHWRRNSPTPTDTDAPAAPDQEAPALPAEDEPIARAEPLAPAEPAAPDQAPDEPPTPADHPTQAFALPPAPDDAPDPLPHDEPAATAPAPAPIQPAPPPVFATEVSGPLGFRERGRLRRRARYLRHLREVQLRDLGSFMLELHRFEVWRGDLVGLKVVETAETDRELRALEGVLSEQRLVQEIREAGIGGSCRRCGAIHGSVDRFCAACGSPLVGEAFETRAPSRTPEPRAASRTPEPRAASRTRASAQRSRRRRAK